MLLDSKYLDMASEFVSFVSFGEAQFFDVTHGFGGSCVNHGTGNECKTHGLFDVIFDAVYHC